MATWVLAATATKPSSGAATENAANATIEFIDSTVARLRASASRWSSVVVHRAAGAVEPVGEEVRHDQGDRAGDQPHHDGAEPVEDAGQRSRSG